MGKRKSSRQWVAQQAADTYVKKRHEQGLRSRAAFKLEQMLERDRLLSRGGRVIDLGAAPGGWTEIAVRLCGGAGSVVAVDKLRMVPIHGATFIQGDCTDLTVQDDIATALGGHKADLVISDMAPNLTGIRFTDEANIVAVLDAMTDVATRCLKPGGALIFKAFAYEDVNQFIRRLTPQFERLKRRKPDASRRGSTEFYVVAQGYKAPGR